MTRALALDDAGLAAALAALQEELQARPREATAGRPYRVRDVQMTTSASRIDVTSFMDDGPQYVQGLSRQYLSLVVEVLSGHSADALLRAIYSGDLLSFEDLFGGEPILGHRLRGQLRLTSVNHQTPVDGLTLVHIEAAVEGQMVLEDVEVEPARQPDPLPDVRRGIDL